MTYIDDEKSDLDPIEFYEFIYGSKTWRFTDSDGSYVHPVSGAVYSPEAISRGDFNQSEEDNSMSVEVIVDTLNPVADFFRTPFLPANQIWLTITRGHIGSIDVATLFRGKVGQCVFDGTTARLSCIPTKNAIVKKVPIQLVQRLCTNTLYDGRCKANPNAFVFVGTVQSFVGLFAIVSGPAASQPAGYFSGGFIEKSDGTAPATILKHLIQLGVPPAPSSASLKLLYNPGYVAGDAVKVYAGCDRRLPTCIQKFNNASHFQGFPFIPIIDPFKDKVG